MRGRVLGYRVMSSKNTQTDETVYILPPVYVQ